MDWSKAKSIMITVFIILNIFLLVYSSIYRSQTNISNATFNNIINVLEKNGVTIEPSCKLPTYNKKTPMLVMENYNLNRKKVLSFLFDKYNENSDEKSYTEGDKSIAFTGSGSFIYNDSGTSIKVNNFGLDMKNIEKYISSIGSINNANNNSIIHFTKDSKQCKQIHNSFCKFFSNIDIKISSFILDRINFNDDGSYTFTFIETYHKYMIFDNIIRVTVFNDG